MSLHCGVLEIYNVTDAFLFCIEQNPYMRPIISTNLNWDRLSLEPITSAKLKPMLRSGLVRIALATEPGLRFITVTRHPHLAGRRAKRTKTGFWEVYEAGRGWVRIANDCHIWLHP